MSTYPHIHRPYYYYDILSLFYNKKSIVDRGCGYVDNWETGGNISECQGVLL